MSDFDKLHFNGWKAVEEKDGLAKAQNHITKRINRLLQGKTYFRGVTLEILTNEETVFLNAMYQILWCSKHNVVPTQLDNRLGMYDSEESISKLVKLVNKLDHYRRACKRERDVQAQRSKRKKLLTVAGKGQSVVKKVKVKKKKTVEQQQRKKNKQRLLLPIRRFKNVYLDQKNLLSTFNNDCALAVSILLLGKRYHFGHGTNILSKDDRAFFNRTRWQSRSGDDRDINIETLKRMTTLINTMDFRRSQQRSLAQAMAKKRWRKARLETAVSTTAIAQTKIKQEGTVATQRRRAQSFLGAGNAGL